MRRGGKEARGGNPGDEARLDRWLWAARFFKTRALAAEAVGGAKVEVNGERAKRAKAVRPGDRIRIRVGPYEYRLTVLETAVRRGSAQAAAALYREDPDGKARRERLAEQHRLARPMFTTGGGKPSKKERRALSRLKGR